VVLDTFAETKVSRRTGAKARIKSEVGHAHPKKRLLGNANPANEVQCLDKKLRVFTVSDLVFTLIHWDVIT